MNVSYPQLALHVAGQWLRQASGGERAVLNPATGEVLALLPLAGPAEIQAAAEAAERGFQVWRRQSAQQRYAVVRRTADLLRERTRLIAEVLTLEQG